jgi:hypothetical protein
VVFRKQRLKKRVHQSVFFCYGPPSDSHNRASVRCDETLLCSVTNTKSRRLVSSRSYSLSLFLLQGKFSRQEEFLSIRQPHVCGARPQGSAHARLPPVREFILPHRRKRYLVSTPNSSLKSLNGDPADTCYGDKNLAFLAKGSV